MTHHRYTNNTRPMDFHKLHRPVPVWRTPAGLGAMAIVIVGVVLMAMAV